MYQRRFGSLSGLKLTGLIVLMVSLIAAPGGALAQDDDAMDNGDMGDCVAALGVGEDGDACINVVHASPDAPAVDVYLDGDAALEGLEFSDFSDWVAVPAGDYQVQVTAEGDEVDAAVIDAEVTVEEGAAYHIVATGLLDDIAPEIFEVDLSEVDDDMARVRVLHASPDAPAVDVAVTDGDVLVEGLEFPEASDFLEVDADTYDLEVRPAGEEDVVLDLAGTELEADMVYDVFAVGLLEDETLDVLIVPSMAMDGDEMMNDD